MKRRVAVLTSGGDAPGMNAAIRSVVRCGVYSGMEVYGIRSGYEGLLDNEIEPMNAASVSDILHRGGTILRTARSKRFMTEEGQELAAKILHSHGITDLVIIGGDGSMAGGLTLAKRGFNIYGIPGTIDNDLAYTDFTIGFDTAVNTAISAISNVRDTSISHERATIIELMGRNCGDIALWAGINSGAENILIPEEEMNLSAIVDKINKGREFGKLHTIIVKAEGVNIESHKLAEILSNEVDMEFRVVVLGYIQRGGSPTAKDRMLGSQMGYEAIEQIKLGENRSLAIGERDGKIVSLPLSDALAMKKPEHNYMLKLANMLSI